MKLGMQRGQGELWGWGWGYEGQDAASIHLLAPGTAEMLYASGGFGLGAWPIAPRYLWSPCEGPSPLLPTPSWCGCRLSSKARDKGYPW